MNQDIATFYEHLLEVRSRLFKIFVVFGLGTTLGFVYNNDIQSVLVAPLGKQLYYTSPMGGFAFLFNTSLFLGALIAIPFVVFHIIKFIAPTIGSKRALFAVKILATSIALTVAGVLFAYNITLPPTLNFLTGFDTESISSLISTTEYLSFVQLYLAAFAIIFQIPLVIFVINTIKPIDPAKMLKTQKYVIVGSFIAAAIISPTPDVMNQTLMAAPIIVLYELSIGIVWVVNRRKKTERRNDIRLPLTTDSDCSTPFDYLAASDEFNPSLRTGPLTKTPAAAFGKSPVGSVQRSLPPKSLSLSGMLNEKRLFVQPPSKSAVSTSSVRVKIKPQSLGVEKGDSPVPKTQQPKSRSSMKPTTPHRPERARYFVDREPLANRNQSRHSPKRNLIDDYYIRRSTVAL
jgi:sec-independent protein translocase protein TatC